MSLLHKLMDSYAENIDGPLSLNEELHTKPENIQRRDDYICFWRTSHFKCQKYFLAIGRVQHANKKRAV